MCYALVRYNLLVGSVAGKGWSCYVLKVLLAAPSSRQNCPSYVVNYLSSIVSQGVLNLAWSLILAALNHVGNGAVNGVSQALSVSAIWPLSTICVLVDRRARNPWVLGSYGSSAVLKGNSKLLVLCIFIVVNNFSTLSIVTYQSVAQCLVASNYPCSSIAGLSVRYAGQVLDSQNVAGSCVNIGNGSLLRIWSIGNDNSQV